MASVQIRGVPDEVHQRLKTQAATSGQSLNEFLLARMTEVAEVPTVPELTARIRSLRSYDGPSSAEVIRQARAQR